MKLDRRQFLAGLFGTAAAAALPYIPQVDVVDLKAWAQAVSKVYGEYISQAIIYGTAAIRSTEVFPYIELISLTEMTDLDLANATTCKDILPITDELSSARKAISDEIGRRQVVRLKGEDWARRHTLGEA